MSHDKEFEAGERLYVGETKIPDDAVLEHKARYELAIRHLKATDVVLDAACGTGYGSEMLAAHVAKVIGLEISDHGLAWARAHHAKHNIEFVKGDLNKKLPFADASFDAVVSFETLEHVENHKTMTAEFYRVLKPGGLLIVSSPDREIITDKAHTENHFHIHELSKPEFIAFVKKQFTPERLYGQTEFIPLPWHKKAVKAAAKLDVFKLRRKILSGLGLKIAVHNALAPFSSHKIVEVSEQEPNKYFVLIGICRKP